MPKGPFGGPRPFGLGPFATDGDLPSTVSSEKDIKPIAESMVYSTPATIQEIKYMGFFDRPSAVIDFEIPPAGSGNIDRVAGKSSVVFDAESTKISEMSIRLGAITDDIATEGQVIAVLDNAIRSANMITDVRSRTAYYEIDGEIHPHVHYSKTREGKYGPPMSIVAEDIHNLIVSWYKTMRLNPFDV